MVGSQDSVAQANIVLNTIVAEAFSDACDILEKADNFDLAVHDLIKDYAVEHQRIVFNGNGYSDEWVAEAERRGLPNIKSMVDAIPAYVAPESVAAFEKFGVFTKTELESRAEIEYETYAKTINIEAKAMIEIAGLFLQLSSILHHLHSQLTQLRVQLLMQMYLFSQSFLQRAQLFSQMHRLHLQSLRMRQQRPVLWKRAESRLFTIEML